MRYYACESMYNIAKVAKGEVLVYFNDVFDALCKLAADTELSVKNGAELLDRLVKDIVSESAATYASILAPETAVGESEENTPSQSIEIPTAFSLPRFIPLLQERILVINPFTRTFLVSWITLLDSIPDLELVAYLPSFLGGLLKFLSDPNQDVHTTTKVALDRFLAEIRKIAEVKKGIAESKKGREGDRKASDSSAIPAESPRSDHANRGHEQGQPHPHMPTQHTSNGNAGSEGDVLDGQSSITAAEEDEGADDEAANDELLDDEWIPGQDVQVDYQRILDILATYLAESAEEEVQLTTLKWIENFLEICPVDILAFTPRLLAQVLPALSHDVDLVRQAASRVNSSLMTYINDLPEEGTRQGDDQDQQQQSSSAPQPAASGSAPNLAGPVKGLRENNAPEKQSTTSLPSKALRKAPSLEPVEPPSRTPELRTPEPPEAEQQQPSASHPDLDYEAAVNALTLQFLHEHEATRVAALAWLIMLHHKSPRRIMAIQDATFPALLKTLSDPAEAVVTRDLLLLSQISKSSDDSYFHSFMVNLLKLFATDRRLLETRGNLIIRQLCTTLSAEKIYRTLASCLEGEGEDIEFASIMVQNLNNNLITAPELADLRKRLRNLDSRDGQTFFTVLFKAWCVNAVATFSLCLLAQAYEQAYNLLQIFAELEMSVNMLIQIDKLVQLLESPVFTYLRMQLLEPERHPHLYKCLYGLLMLLPQSSAFAALKNRLNSVSAIGYLHMPRAAPSATTPSSVSTFERQNRLKSREEGTIKWTELLEKFKSTQERVRRAQQRQLGLKDEREQSDRPPPPNLTLLTTGAGVRGVEGAAARQGSVGPPPSREQGHQKSKSGLSQLGRLARGGASKGKK